MLVMKQGYGAARGSLEVEIDGSGSYRSVAPGETLRQYPWERSIRQEQELERVRGEVYPSPIRYGATPVGRPGPMADEMLVALASHGADPFDTAQVSVRDLVDWYHTGDSEQAAYDEVGARYAVLRNLQASRSIDTGMQSYVDGAADLALAIEAARGRVR